METKLRYASYGLDEGPHLAADAHEARLAIPDLIEAARESGKPYLMLGHMSPLFGGMCNALPVASKPVFEWEAKHQSAVWRDVYGHVHWPWLVNSYRDHRFRIEFSTKDGEAFEGAYELVLIGENDIRRS